jgi:protein-L-isoaspartate(D-aspartate) O-methyltransferase
LAAKAKDACAALGLTNVACKAAACSEGDAAAAPYDVIVLNGATEVTPAGLLGQLKEGGRLVGVSAESRPPRAMIVTHTHGEFGHRALFDAAAPVLPGLERAAAFVF